LNYSFLALVTGILLSVSGSFVGGERPDHEGHHLSHAHTAAHVSTHSPAFERQLERNAENLVLSEDDLDSTGLATPAQEEDEIIIWNPISGSVSSGCTLSGCLGSGCVGSGCSGSGCVGSACGGSACGGSACGASGCAGSGCGLSGCVGSACGLSGCVGSVCTQSGCVGSGCIVSGCKISICVVSGCINSYCVGSLCKDSACVGSVGCKTNCIKKAQQDFAENPKYGQEYSWWVAYGRSVNPGGWVPYVYLDPVTAQAWELAEGTYETATDDQIVFISQTTGKSVPKSDLTEGEDGQYYYYDENLGDDVVANAIEPIVISTTDANGDPVELELYLNPFTGDFFDPATGETVTPDEDLVKPYQTPWQTTPDVGVDPDADVDSTSTFK